MNIEYITESTRNILIELKIGSDIEYLPLETIIIIQSEIQKIIKSSDEFYKIPPKDRLTNIMDISRDIFRDPTINAMLSDNVKNQLNTIHKNERFIETIHSILIWTSDNLLDHYDSNNDGIVSQIEIKNNTFKCCFPRFCCNYWKKPANFISNCWSWFFIRCLCCKCNSNAIPINDNIHQ